MLFDEDHSTVLLPSDLPHGLWYDSFLEAPICQSTGGNHMLSIWYYGFNHSAGLAEAAFYLAFIGTSPGC
jgi:hypothetical protein